MKTPFTYASRDDIAVELQIIEGVLPGDLCGHVFLNSPCGTVNNAPPIPEYFPDGTINSEFGEMIFNGDAMLFRFDLEQPGRLFVRSSLLKTPCYYADYATRYGTDYYRQGHYFRGMGMARTSMYIGSRNQLNTSINLFKFPGDAHTRVTVNFDAGRFYELDPASLQLKTPIGANSEWHSEFPAGMAYTFPLVLSTAHPSFDPLTGEFFTVNYLKSASNLAFSTHRLLDKLSGHQDLVTKHVQTLHTKLHGRRISGLALPVLLARLLTYIERLIGQPKDVHPAFDVDAMLQNAEKTYHDIFGMENAVYLLRWTGEQAPLHQWRVIDEQGQDLFIAQCMHQTNFSKDYLVLVDSSVKFALDIMFSVPFPKAPWLDELLRWITAKTILPQTPLYFIRRADLDLSKDTVTAKTVIAPLETVHFSIDYDNPGGLVTLHTAHNTASCAAEWIRPYDHLATDPGQKVYRNTIGLMTCGEMDIGRIGKFVVNGETGQIVTEDILHAKGFEGDQVDQVKAHTWGVALNTYRDILSAERPVARIRKNFWQCYGLDKRMLTHFIWSLYFKYENRLIPADKLLEYTRQGVPFCLLCHDTETMQFTDYWLFRMNENLRSIQFVPRRRPGGIPPGIDEQTDGYILCTMVIGPPDLPPEDVDYQREIWLFDAAALHQGPVCRMQHPDLQFAFTIHSVWSPECVSSAATYNIPVRADYDSVIAQFKNPEKQASMRQFMEENVYPHF